MTRAAPRVAAPAPRTGVHVATVKLPEPYLSMLDALADKLDVNRSEVIRLAIARLHERIVT